MEYAPLPINVYAIIRYKSAAREYPIALCAEIFRSRAKHGKKRSPRHRTILAGEFCIGNRREKLRVVFLGTV